MYPSNYGSGRKAKAAESIVTHHGKVPQNSSVCNTFPSLKNEQKTIFTNGLQNIACLGAFGGTYLKHFIYCIALFFLISLKKMPIAGSIWKMFFKKRKTRYTFNKTCKTLISHFIDSFLYHSMNSGSRTSIVNRLDKDCQIYGPWARSTLQSYHKACGTPRGGR